MPKPSRLRDHMVLFLKGAAVGAAQIVPGVSGGTLALVLGIYEKLITSVGATTQPPFLGALARRRLGAAYRAVNGTFLLLLGLGIAASVLLLSGLLSWLLERYQSLVFAFFFGLVVASIIAVGRRVRPWSRGPFAMFVLGSVGGFLVVGLTPADTPDGFFFLALSGALAVSTLLLPGISGAFVLVLLGHYQTALEAIARGDVATLTPFAIGAAAGLLGFTRLLSWLLDKAYNPTLALLTGFMLGSLRKLWPWQAVGTGTDLHLPTPPTILPAAALALVGALAIVAIERSSPRS